MPDYNKPLEIAVLQRNCFILVCNCASVFAFYPIDDPTIVVCISVAEIQSYCLLVILQGPLILALDLVGHSSIVKSCC